MKWDKDKVHTVMSLFLFFAGVLCLTIFLRSLEGTVVVEKGNEIIGVVYEGGKWALIFFICAVGFHSWKIKDDSDSDSSSNGGAFMFFAGIIMLLTKIFFEL